MMLLTCYVVFLAGTRLSPVTFVQTRHDVLCFTFDQPCTLLGFAIDDGVSLHESFDLST